MANEKRLIDVSKTINRIQMYIDENVEQKNPVSCFVLGLIIKCLEQEPAVDAVEVVRCKDCKHSVWDEENEMWKCVESADYDEYSGEWFGFYEYRNGGFFCADGERKGGIT